MGLWRVKVLLRKKRAFTVLGWLHNMICDRLTRDLNAGIQQIIEHKI